MAGSTRLGKPCTRDRRDHVEAEDSSEHHGLKSTVLRSQVSIGLLDTCDCSQTKHALYIYLQSPGFGG